MLRTATFLGKPRPISVHSVRYRPCKNYHNLNTSYGIPAYSSSAINNSEVDYASSRFSYTELKEVENIINDIPGGNEFIRRYDGLDKQYIYSEKLILDRVMTHPVTNQLKYSREKLDNMLTTLRHKYYP